MYSFHNHTDISNAMLGFSDSTIKVEKLIQYAYDIGLDGICITEHESVSSHVTAEKYFHSMKLERPFKLARGNEIYLMTEEESLNNLDKECEVKTPYYHGLLVALDGIGHKQIRELSTKAWIRAYTYRGLMRKPTYYTDIEEVIGANKGHVVYLSACLGSYIDRQIIQWKNAEINNEPFIEFKKNINGFILWGINTFGKENFNLEVQPCNIDNQDQMIVNKTLYELSKVYGLNIVPTTDSHYLIKSDAFIHKVYLKSKDADREVESFYSTTYVMKDEELKGYLRNCFDEDTCNQLLENTKLIGDRVEGYTLNKLPEIPRIPLDKIPPFTITNRFEPYYSKYPQFAHYSYTKDYHEQYFFFQVEEALQKWVVDKGKDLDVYINRLDIEFNELKLVSDALESSMPCYYSTMSKIIDIVWESDSLCMAGRGSSCVFLLCYLLEITQIDPVPLGDYMPYWRHVSFERGIEIADIDNDSQSTKKDAIVNNMIEYFGADRTLAVATIARLTSKTAVEKSVKGLGLGDDLAGYLKSLVPVERGEIWGLNDVYYGSVEKERKPITEFVNEVNKYDGLKECIFGLEGIAQNRGQHPAGIVIGTEPYVNSISAIRSPKGVLMTCFDLHESEFCSQTKFDMLNVASADKIRNTMDLLINYGKMEWKGDLKSTYNFYLHPDVLEYDEPKMWDMLLQVYDIFQFSTPIAIQALSKTHARTVMDLSATNSLLRLKGEDGKENPLDTYARYKADINEWVKDCTEYGLKQDEMDTLSYYLSNSYMLADSQEKIMLLSMDKRVVNFTLKQANLLRKAIAKKSEKVLKQVKAEFFKSGLEINTRQVFLDYVWNEVFAKSFGYVTMLMFCEPNHGCVA